MFCASRFLAAAIVNGLLAGAVYALVSVALTLVYGVLHIINFAHGAILTAAMFAAYFRAAGGRRSTDRGVRIGASVLCPRLYGPTPGYRAGQSRQGQQFASGDPRPCDPHRERPARRLRIGHANNRHALWFFVNRSRFCLSAGAESDRLCGDLRRRGAALGVAAEDGHRQGDPRRRQGEASAPRWSASTSRMSTPSLSASAPPASPSPPAFCCRATTFSRGRATPMYSSRSRWWCSAAWGRCPAR